MTTLISIGVVYAALSVGLSIILVIGGWRVNGSNSLISTFCFKK
jgi:hypothetical protein